MWPLAPSGAIGHYKGVIMALIELSTKQIGNKALVLSTKSKASVAFGDTTEINPIEALVYLGDNRFKITFTPKDKSILQTCNEHQLEWLRTEFKVKGNADKILKKMFPSPTVKKKLTAVVKSKSDSPNKESKTTKENSKEREP